jgi:hypothetical protein
VAASEPPPPSVTAGLNARDEELLACVRRFATAPFGLTLSGLAYSDNPILYANRTFREIMCYPLADLRGENPRLTSRARRRTVGRHSHG